MLSVLGNFCSKATASFCEFVTFTLAKSDVITLYIFEISVILDLCSFQLASGFFSAFVVLVSLSSRSFRRRRLCLIMNTRNLQERVHTIKSSTKFVRNCQQIWHLDKKTLTNREKFSWLPRSFWMGKNLAAYSDGFHVCGTNPLCAELRKWLNG